MWENERKQTNKQKKKTDRQKKKKNCRQKYVTWVESKNLKKTKNKIEDFFFFYLI